MQKHAYQNSLCPSFATKSQSNMHRQTIGMFHFLLSLILSSLLIATSDPIPAVPDPLASLIATPTVTEPQNVPVNIDPAPVTTTPVEPTPVPIEPAQPQPEPEPAQPQPEPEATVPTLPSDMNPDPQNVPEPAGTVPRTAADLLSHLPKPGDLLHHIPKPSDINIDPAALPNLQPNTEPQTPDSPSSNPEDATVAKDFLYLHNVARRHAKLPPMVWDTKLEEYARQYASQRANGDCSLVHSMGPYGENLFWGRGSKWRPRDAVRKWIKEHKFYDQDSNQCKHGRTCGHYTQVVWRDSTRVGCAVAKCLNDDTYTVCSYDPPGNYLGEKPYIHYTHPN